MEVGSRQLANVNENWAKLANSYFQIRFRVTISLMLLADKVTEGQNCICLKLTVATKLPPADTFSDNHMGLSYLLQLAS